VASWYADGQNGQSFFSSLVQVNAGDTLTGIMTLVVQNGAAFDYSCEFQGIANTTLAIQAVGELTWANETLEVYGVTDCGHYPETSKTSFAGINLQTGSATPMLNWTVNNSHTECGQHANVVNGAATGGQVDIWYTRQPGWNGDWFPLPGQAVFDRQTQQIAAVARSPNNLDLFVIGNDDHVWSTFWSSQTGWSADWFPLPGQAVFDRQTQQIAAVARSPNNLDLFVIGNNNHVWSTFWSG
jgi:hypothetical protein